MTAAEIKSDIDKHVEVGDVSIHYEYFGKKDRPVIIIFNGVAMETSSWNQFLPHVVNSLDVLVWDFRGQGKSTSDDAEYSIEDFADYLKAIIDDLELKSEQTFLVGISSGTIVQSEFMRKYPDRFNKAVMAGVLLSPAKTFQLQNSFAIEIMKTDVGLWGDSLYCLLLSDTFIAQIEQYIPKLKKALKERYENRVHALGRIMEAQNKYIADVEKYYSEYIKLDKEILLIAGEEDRMTPTFYQKRVLDLFPNIEYKEYAGVGHMVVMEKPKEFFDDVKSFVLG